MVLCNRSQQMVEFQAYFCRKTYATADTSSGHEEELALMVEFLLLRRMKTYSARSFTAAGAELHRRVSLKR